MHFFQKNWLTFVISMNNSLPQITNKGLLYFGIELLILIVVGFIVIKLINRFFD